MDILQIITNLLALTLLEIVLGIDNLVFIAIVSHRLPVRKQLSARRLGIALALLGRFALLAGIGWVIQLNKPLFDVMEYSFSGRAIFMILGGIFLLTKGTWEIHHEVEVEDNVTESKRPLGFFSCIVQIVLFDAIFSLDSILTAVGLTKHIWMMMVAITIAAILMLLANEPLSKFIRQHPTIKMLALSFLLLIGAVLLADGFGYEIPKGYIYFSICFSLVFEALNILRRRNKKIKGAM